MRSYCILLFAFFSCLSTASEEIPGLDIKEIENGIFLHKSYRLVDGWGLVSSNGLIVTSEGKAFIVDTPWSNQDTERLVSWIRSNNYELLGSISTHSHDDRTAGINWLNDNSIATYAAALTNNILQQEGKETVKHPIDGEEFELADGLLEVFYPGGGHTIDNVVVWLPDSRILFGGCFVRSLESKGLGYTGEARLDQWSSSAQKTISRFPEVKIIVPGHGKLGDAQLLEHTRNLADKAFEKSIRPTAKTSSD